MFYVRLAELNICIDNRYSYVQKMCSEYTISSDRADFSVSVTREEIFAEEDGRGFDVGYLESLALYRKIAEKIVEFDGFLMHGVVIETKGQGIAFLAKSGVGKTTHMRLWSSLLGDKLTVVNGDKPLIRIVEGNVFAYGTPWAGKENLHKNTKTELKKICFIKRSEFNECFKITKNNVFEQLIQQVYKPKNSNKLIKTVDLLERLIEQTDFYTIMCNTDPESAIIAYERLVL